MLAFGLDFAQPPFEIHYLHYIHYLLSCKFYHGFTSCKIFSSIFSASDVKLVRDLAANEDLVVIRPNKGNGAVIIDKEAWIDSMEGIVSDTDRFFPCILILNKNGLLV